MSCNNKLMIPRKRVEALILNDLREKFLTVENLQYVYKNEEKAVSLALKELLGTVELEPVPGECLENG